MAAHRTVCVALLVALAFPGAMARSSSGLARLERLLSSSSSSSSSSSMPLGFLSGDEHSVNKRIIFDQSCKGVYDRSLFKKLEVVCEDCYNLYRKPHVAASCRKDCYGNMVFRQCLDDLLLVDVIDEYVTSVQMVGK